MFNEALGLIWKIGGPQGILAALFLVSRVVDSIADGKEIDPEILERSEMRSSSWPSDQDKFS